MASNPLLNFDNVGPDTSQIKLKQNNIFKVIVYKILLINLLIYIIKYN